MDAARAKTMSTMPTLPRRKSSKDAPKKDLRTRLGGLGPQKWRFSLYSTGKAKLRVGTVVPTVTESETEDIVSPVVTSCTTEPMVLQTPFSAHGDPACDQTPTADADPTTQIGETPSETPLASPVIPSPTETGSRRMSEVNLSSVGRNALFMRRRTSV
jgi:hypothetical protein